MSSPNVFEPSDIPEGVMLHGMDGEIMRLSFEVAGLLLKSTDEAGHIECYVALTSSIIAPVKHHDLIINWIDAENAPSSMA